VAQPLLAMGLLRTKPGISILMYHSVSDDPEPGVSPYYRLTTSPARFREHMRWLHDHGYAVIDLAEALRRLETGSLDHERAVVVTFDDGFRDFFTNAWPVLAEFGFTATMFLPTAFITNGRRSFKGRECLTWHEVRKLHANGVSFGAHTISHRKLDTLPWAEVGRELRDSRLQIEHQLRAPVSLFAYPYAFPQENRDFVNRFRRELIEHGYAGAVTTVIGRAQRGSDRLSLARLPVNQSDDEALFLGKLSGAYDWMGSLQFFVRRTRNPSTALKSVWNAWQSSPAT
jgi:peptidoglycan/xylan/chitin deacetylase (PgdA/CDA1 family)